LKYGEGVRLIALKESSVRSDGKKGKKRARVNESSQPQRRCGKSGKTGHNTRTCKHKEDTTLK